MVMISVRRLIDVVSSFEVHEECLVALKSEKLMWVMIILDLHIVHYLQVAEERLANMRTVRAFVGEKRETDVYDSRVDKVLNLSYKEAIARGIFWAMVTICFHVYCKTMYSVI